MRKFLLTSPKFNGEVEVLYDGPGRLVRFDVMNTDLNQALIDSFKRLVPTHVDDLATAFKAMTIIESTYEVDFMDFWKTYDHKVNKKRCEPLWVKLTIADRIKAVHGVPLYKRFLSGLPYKRAIADPEKYLKDRYWENEWK